MQRLKKAHPSQKSFSRGEGFTLTELAIVLGVVGVIIAGIWSAAGIVNERARLSGALTELAVVSQGMTALFQGGYGIQTSPCQALPAPCDITGPMVTSTSLPQPYGNPTTLKANDPWNATGFSLIWVSSNPATYRMAFYQVSQASCAAFIMSATACTPGKPGCPILVGVAGTPPPAYTAPSALHSFSTANAAMTTTESQALCAFNNYAGGTNSVEFDFLQ